MDQTDRMEVIRQAFESLNNSHPKAFLSIVKALAEADNKSSEAQLVEAAFREAAAGIEADDEGAAETLLGIADLLAEIDPEGIR